MINVGALNYKQIYENILLDTRVIDTCIRVVCATLMEMRLSVKIYLTKLAMNWYLQYFLKKGKLSFTVFPLKISIVFRCVSNEKFKGN